MDADLREALDALHDLREFWKDNVTQTHVGAGHHNPIWLRVAEVLSKHGLNNTSASGPHAERYRRFDVAYFPKS